LKLIAIVTKSELVSKKQLAEQLLAVQALRDWSAIIPVSAVAADQLEELADLPQSHDVSDMDELAD